LLLSIAKERKIENVKSPAALTIVGYTAEIDRILINYIVSQKNI